MTPAQQCHEFSDLPALFIPGLVRLGVYLSADPVLWAKAVRVCRAALRQMSEMAEQPSDASDGMRRLQSCVLEVLDAALLPALSMLECNAPMSFELWDLLKYFPYETRHAAGRVAHAWYRLRHAAQLTGRRLADSGCTGSGAIARTIAFPSWRWSGAACRRGCAV